MSEYLMREGAPLSESEWESLDKVVVKVASQFLVGRQFIKLVGPLGVGTEMVPVGTGDKRHFLPLNLIQQSHNHQACWQHVYNPIRLCIRLKST